MENLLSFMKMVDSSEIDYILTKCDPAVIQTTVEDKRPLNLSDHIMLSVRLLISYCLKQRQCVIIPVKLKWHKCDQILFKESVRTQIQQSFLCQHTNSAYDIECQIRTLTDILKAGAENIPGYTAEMVKKTSQKPRKWNLQIYGAIRVSQSMGRLENGWKAK